MREAGGDESRRFFALSDRVQVFPVVNGSADFALAVRDELLGHRYDCLAVPLPPSFRDSVLDAVAKLPEVSAVVQSAGEGDSRFSYVPIDPSQAVIRALRIAQEERMSLAFIDQELRDFQGEEEVFPDPYALRSITPMQFAAAVLTVSPPPESDSQREQRTRRMAFELHKLELDFERILFVGSIVDWVWIKDAYDRRLPYPEAAPYFAPIETWPVSPDTLAFFLSETPWITHLYEANRRGIEEEKSLSIDGVKELLLETRDRLGRRRKALSKRITVQVMRLYLQYVRNLTLIRRRLRPDLVTLVSAAKQVMGDDFAIELLRTARHYPEQPDPGPRALRMSIQRAEIPQHGVVALENRLPGQRMEWRRVDLRPEPDAPDRSKWTQAWDPHKQCSWPPEDSRVESFNLHVREQAKNMISSDLARVEKFTSSIKDGVDIRETLRNWHTGDIWVREQPPARGSIEVVVFLFEVPADPDKYTWRTTWFAEHEEESTLVFYATDYRQDMVGPGIAQARYGGAFFLFPPRPLLDIWRDPSFRFAKTLEERLLAAALWHSRERYVAVVSPCPLRASWRRLARRFGKQMIHLPLHRFSSQIVDRLRTFHVLNGQEIRSYAARFIRNVE